LAEAEFAFELTFERLDKLKESVIEREKKKAEKEEADRIAAEEKEKFEKEKAEFAEKQAELDKQLAEQKKLKDEEDAKKKVIRDAKDEADRVKQAEDKAALEKEKADFEAEKKKLEEEKASLAAEKEALEKKDQPIEAVGGVGPEVGGVTEGELIDGDFHIKEATEETAEVKPEQPWPREEGVTQSASCQCYDYLKTLFDDSTAGIFFEQLEAGNIPHIKADWTI